MADFGATGRFPDGSLGPSDEGELQFGVARDSKGNVVINFGSEVSWLAMPPETAMSLAALLCKQAGGNLVLAVERTLLLEVIQAASHALKSYAHGNGSPDLAVDVAAKLDRVLAASEKV